MIDSNPSRIVASAGAHTGHPKDETLLGPLALILAGLAAGRSTLSGLGRGANVEAAVLAMREMGARVEWSGGRWQVEGTGNGCLLEPRAPFDFGGAQMAAVLVAGLVATYDMETVVDGIDDSGQGAPIGSLLAPLRAMGVQVLASAPGERLPVRLAGPRAAAPITWPVPAHATWVRPALLLASLNTAGVTSIVTSLGDEDGVEAMLRHFGAKIDVKEGAASFERTVSIEGRGRLVGCTVTMQGGTAVVRPSRGDGSGS